MYECIVVGTDGSETGKLAVAEAASLAKALGAKLHVVSAYESGGANVVAAPKAAAQVWEVRPGDAARSAADQAEAAARLRGLDAAAHVVKGDPADALLKIAAEKNAEMIVVGSRGMHGVGRVLGSVPNKVSHRARCHVLIVATEAD